MTRRRTPQEKKLDEYTKDHVEFSESVHAFRKNWPRKKVRATRTYRRTVHQAVDVLVYRQEEDFPDFSRPETLRRSTVRKWHYVEPMGDIIKQRLDRRIRSTAHYFFIYEYDSLRDRERFIGFLSSCVEGCTENSRELARHFKDIIAHSPKAHGPNYWHRRKQKWLQAFFQDEPEWQARLSAWIASFEQE